MPKTEADEAFHPSELTKGSEKGKDQIAVPLMVLEKGEWGIVAQKIQAGRGACRRLTELGLIPGTPIQMVNKIKRGPVLIRVKGTKLAIGRGLATKIRVYAQ